MRWKETGFITLDDIKDVIPPEEYLKKHPIPIIECVEEIPCTPCYEICPTKAIQMENINAIPKLDPSKCTGCLLCAQICPGLAIFPTHFHAKGKARVYIPYEFLPIPNVGDKVLVLNREGKPIGEGTVFFVLPREKSIGDTVLVGVEVPREIAFEARHIKVMKE
ncbi:MAG: 4Fe-4S binding protein [Euryarchaeota archaeon]|nr:4Fe-4S binding protein [Euryarchaeota archaeon]